MFFWRRAMDTCGSDYDRRNELVYGAFRDCFYGQILVVFFFCVAVEGRFYVAVNCV